MPDTMEKSETLLVITQNRTNGGKRLASFTAKIGEFYGEGKTRTAARENLYKKIALASAHDYQPVVVEHAGAMALITQEPEGVRTMFCWQGQSLSERLRSYSCSWIAESKKVAEQSAATNLVQQTTDIDAIHTVEDVPTIVTDDKCKRELVYWCRWQRAARYAKAIGMVDDGSINGVHRWACDHCTDEQFA